MKRPSPRFLGRRPLGIGIERRVPRLIGVLRKQRDRDGHAGFCLDHRRRGELLGRICVERLAGSGIRRRLDAAPLGSLMRVAPRVVRARAVERDVRIPGQARGVIGVFGRRDAGQAARALLHVATIPSAVGEPGRLLRARGLLLRLGELVCRHLELARGRLEFIGRDLVALERRELRGGSGGDSERRPCVCGRLTRLRGARARSVRRHEKRQGRFERLQAARGGCREVVPRIEHANPRVDRLRRERVGPGDEEANEADARHADPRQPHAEHRGVEHRCRRMVRRDHVRARERRRVGAHLDIS